VEVNVAGAYIYYTIPVLGGIPITQTTVSLLLVTILLCTAFVLLGRNLKKRPAGKQVLVEKGVAMLQNLVVSAMGEHNMKFVPLIGTIFLSSIFGSLIGMTGIFRSTTADLSVPLVWAVLVTLVIWYQNIKHNGFLGWLKGFTEPVVVMTPMNLLSEVAQPISMAFRHFGNVAGGGVITSILYTGLSLASSAVLNAIASSGVIVSVVMLVLCGVLGILFGKKKKKRFLVLGILMGVLGILGLLQALDILSGVPIFTFGIPAVLSLYFDLFSGFVQALVFSMLSMAYIAAACPPPEEKQAE
jgi:F-type H+-transporting ATPase subunit a